MGQWSEVVGGLRVSGRIWGSGTELEGTGLVLYVLFGDWDEEPDANTKCDFSAILLCLCHWFSPNGLVILKVPWLWRGDVSQLPFQKVLWSILWKTLNSLKEMCAKDKCP